MNQIVPADPQVFPAPVTPVSEQLANTVPATFADLINEVRTWDDWCLGKRGQRITNIRQCVSIAGHSAGIDRPTPAQIPCSVPWLNDHLFRGTSVMFGLEDSSRHNTVSGLREVLVRLGVIDRITPRHCRQIVHGIPIRRNSGTQQRNSTTQR
jgi:hypothetical protein